MTDQNLTYEDIDEQIRKQLDIVTALLGSGKRNQDSTKQALTALNQLRVHVVSEISGLRDDVTR